MKNSGTLYRLEVAPLLILPLTRSPFFSYASDHEVPLGSLVSISFGTRSIEGIVYGCQVLPGTKPTWMKYFSQVLVESCLTDVQRELALLVSEEYFTPLGRTLKHFLPKRVTERKKGVVEKETKKKTLRAKKDEQLLVTSFLDTPHQDIPRFLDTSLLLDPKRLVALIAKAVAGKKQQTLVIVPEIIMTLGLEATLKDFFSTSNLAVLHSKLSDGAYFTLWERIRSGEASVIVATRQGLFAPFAHLGAIIVMEEQDESYKQWDMSPRYHGKRVAHFLATLAKAPLLLTSGTPSLDTLEEIGKDHMRALQPIAIHPPIAPLLHIVNLKLERYRRNFSPLSEELALALRDAIDRGEQALLYINRQGMNAFSVCEKCKNVFRCPKCDHPLTSTKDGSFRCVSCSFVTSLFPNCPSCGHLTFRHVGFGTERIEKEVRKLLPKARVARLDSTTLRTPKILEIISTQGRNNEIDVLIGTQMILKDPPLPRLSLIAMIDADSVLLFPDFQADERLYRDLSRATRQIAAQSKGRVFVQTFRPDGAFFQKIAGKKSKDVLKQLLSEREELSYPPYFRFLSFTCQGKSEAEALKKAEALSLFLEKNIPKGYRLSSPRKSLYVKKKNLFEYVILIRFSKHENFPDTFRALLKKKSTDCIIDIDPLQLK